MENTDDYLVRLEILISNSLKPKLQFLKELGISKSTYYRWKEGKPPRAVDVYTAIDEYTQK